MSNTTDTKPAKQWTHYTTEDVESALQLLCLRNGSVSAVEREIGIATTTLSYWRDKKYADRYQQIRTTIFPKLHAKITAMHEDNARAALEKAREALEQLDLTQIKQADLPKALVALSTTSGIHTDKAWIGRDKPTVIEERRSSRELLDAIARRAPSLIHNEAEPIQDAEVVEDTGTSLVGRS